jgi:hypothetical protein
MKRLVGIVVMLASIGISSGSAHATTRAACVWPHVATSTGVCIYMPTADSQ